MAARQTWRAVIARHSGSFGSSSEPRDWTPRGDSCARTLHHRRPVPRDSRPEPGVCSEPEPGVAQSWDIGENFGRSSLVHINPRARWSNGESMTAADCDLVWQRLLSPALGSGIRLYVVPGKTPGDFNMGAITDFAGGGRNSRRRPHPAGHSLDERTPYFIQLMDSLQYVRGTPAHHREIRQMTDRLHALDAGENMIEQRRVQAQGLAVVPPHRSGKERYLLGPRQCVKLNGVIFCPTENVVSEERMFRVGQLHYTGSVPLGKIPVYQEMANSPTDRRPTSARTTACSANPRP